MKKILVLIVISTACFAHAQQDTIRVDENIMEFQWDLDIEGVNDRDCNNIIDPQFPGGEEALFQFIQESLVVSPLSKDDQISGTLYVTFIIEKDGSISSFECSDGNETTRKDLFKMLEKMPLWEPGLYCGEAKRTKYTLPITVCWR